LNKEVVGLEDQLSLVPGKGETSDLERFKQVLNICVRNTCRYTNDPLKEGAVSCKNGKSSHLVQHLYIFH